MSEKKCSRCEVIKPFSDFWRDKSKKSGYRSYCKECKPDRSAYHSAWYKKTRDENPERIIEYQRKRNKKRRSEPDKQREQQLRYNYGISLDEYHNMVRNQNGLCKICNRPPEATNKGKSFAVDHDHDCCPGKKSCGECIRGLLCVTCNQALGMFLDDEDILRSAIEYLQKNSRLNVRGVLGVEAGAMHSYFG